jgi:hypothetical protein
MIAGVFGIIVTIGLVELANTFHINFLNTSICIIIGIVSFVTTFVLLWTRILSFLWETINHKLNPDGTLANKKISADKKNYRPTSDKSKGIPPSSWPPTDSAPRNLPPMRNLPPLNAPPRDLPSDRYVPPTSWPPSKSEPGDLPKSVEKPNITEYIPSETFDNVHFTVTAPILVKAGEWFILDVWSHLDVQRSEVLSRSRDQYKIALYYKTKGPVKVTRGTVLTLRFYIEKAEVDFPEDMIYWIGEIGHADFRARFAMDTPKGSYPGMVTVHVENLQVARLYFDIVVGGESGGKIPKREKIIVHEERHKKAFVSYSSKDRNEVLTCVQGLQKGVPDLEIFMDVLSLRSGQYWEQELRNVIPKSDVFYLFWSQNAKDSCWVEKEWRCALETRGLDFIDPIPLVSPDLVPPPTELKGRHFSDWTLNFMRKLA